MSLFERLKRETRLSHDELERDLNLLSADFTLSDYRRVLEKFLGVYAPVERAVESSVLKNHYHGRWKLHLLEKDLVSLGRSRDELGEIPEAEEFRELTDLAQLIGTLYVLEGSSLGALILTKHFGLRFNLDSLNGLAFFKGYGDETLSRWKEWREFSEDFALKNDLSDSSIVGQANKTFSVLRNWMCTR